jgi:hypothetical protein
MFTGYELPKRREPIKIRGRLYVLSPPSCRIVCDPLEPRLELLRTAMFRDCPSNIRADGSRAVESPFVCFEDLSVAASSEQDAGRRQELLRRADRALDEWEQMLHAWVADKGESSIRLLPNQPAA